MHLKAKTLLLLQWHSRHLDYQLPEPYSLEWNLNVKLAIQDMNKYNKVLNLSLLIYADLFLSLQAGKINRSRILWNNSKFEIIYAFYYFILLLMDRWIILFSGGNVLTLITIKNPQFGFGQGSALLFFLLATVVIELESRNIWKKLETLTSEKSLMKSHECVASAIKLQVDFKKKLFISSIVKILPYVAIIFALTTLFLWFLSSGWIPVVIYFAMVIE